MCVQKPRRQIKNNKEKKKNWKLFNETIFHFVYLILLKRHKRSGASSKVSMACPRDFLLLFSSVANDRTCAYTRAAFCWKDATVLLYIGILLLSNFCLLWKNIFNRITLRRRKICVIYSPITTWTHCFVQRSALAQWYMKKLLSRKRFNIMAMFQHGSRFRCSKQTSPHKTRLGIFTKYYSYWA